MLRTCSSPPEWASGDAADLTVQVAGERQMPIVRSLMNGYLSELAEMVSLSAHDAQTRACLELGAHWRMRERFACLFLRHGLPVGFALIRRAITALGRENEIVEFGVAARHRRRGAGSAALALIFARWPGRWTLHCHSHNGQAVAFWNALVLQHASSVVRRTGVDGRVGPYIRYELKADDGNGAGLMTWHTTKA